MRSGVPERQPITNTSTSQLGPNNVDVAAAMISGLLTELSGGREIDTSEVLSTSQQLLNHGRVERLIAYVDEEPAGVLTLNECAAVYAGGRFDEITELYFKPEYRCHGIAALLLSEARSFAQTRGWKRLEVGAPDQPEWQRTLKFYQREGFIDIGSCLRLLLLEA
ncbi:MAG: GNAT family N-acetyltransferase [Pseudomonadota bacterium]